MGTGLASANPQLTDRDWTQLLKRIRDGQCSPFLGAGVNGGLLPLGGDIAQAWSTEYEYPLPDKRDLARVAQYLALTGPERVYPKSLLQESFEQRIHHLGQTAEFPLPRTLRDLAALPLPVFLTTNYDDFLMRALRRCHKDPRSELCCWNDSLKDTLAIHYPSGTDGSGVEVEFGHSHFESDRSYKPSPAAPMVYHLHGHYCLLDSMVLTENDYLDFLVYLSRDLLRIPSRIKEALTRSSLIFMGYSLADYNFRVLFRGLVQSFPESSRLSVSIQLKPDDPNLPEGHRDRAMQYLMAYFGDIKIKVYWGTAEEFMAELLQRWSEFSSSTGP